jgi:hypothetical protein
MVPGPAELLALGVSLGVLAGWRLYVSVLLTGLALRYGWFELPAALTALEVLANPWVLGLSALGALAELFADKVAWLDSLWDGVHTLIRPLGGALLAWGMVGAQDPVWQVLAVLLGGGAALVSHGAKSGTRALVNTSPEPFSNVAVSAAEDVATAGLWALLIASPWIAVAVLLLVLVACGWIVWKAWGLITRRGRRAAGPAGG